MSHPDKGNSVGERLNHNPTDPPVQPPADISSPFGLGLDSDLTSSYMDAELNDTPSSYPQTVDLTMDEAERISGSGKTSQSFTFPSEARTENSQNANQGAEKPLKEDRSQARTEGPKLEDEEPDKKSDVASEMISEDPIETQRGLSQRDVDQFIETLPARNNTSGPTKPRSGITDIVDVESWGARETFADFSNGVSEQPTDSGDKSERRENPSFANNMTVETISLGVKTSNMLDMLAPNESTSDKTATPSILESQDEEPTFRAFPAVNPNSLLHNKNEADKLDSSPFPQYSNANTPIPTTSRHFDDSNNSMPEDGQSMTEVDTLSHFPQHDNANMLVPISSGESDKSNDSESDSDETMSELDSLEQIDNDDFKNLHGNRVPNGMVDRQSGKKADDVDKMYTESDATSILSFHESTEGENESDSGKGGTALSAKNTSPNRKSLKRTLNDTLDDVEGEDNQREVRGIEVAALSSADPCDTFPIDPEDPYAWQYEVLDEADEDENEAAAARFAVLKEEYMAKKCARKLTLNDEIYFIQAEKEEAARLKRLELEDQFAAGSQDQSESEFGSRGSSDEEDIFISIHESSRSASKRRHQETQADIGNQHVSETPRKRRKLNDSYKRLKKYIFHDSMLAGIEPEIDKHKSKERAKKTAAKKKAVAGVKGKRRSKKSKADANDSDFDPDEDAKAAAAKKKETKKVIERAPTGLQDPSTLLSSNFFEDSNAPLGHATLPLSTDSETANLVNQLITSVPLDDQSFAEREKKHVLKEIIELGQRKIKPDGNGGWAVKGMKFPLTNHQILGAAWMHARETGTDEPLGGLIAGEKGFGKTVQMLGCMIANPPPPNTRWCKGTLVVVSDINAKQWATEIDTYVEKNFLGPVITYFGNGKLQGSGAAEVLQSAGIILTTYSQVARSYPTFKPPKGTSGLDNRKEWWHDYYMKERGVFHQLAFFRVVLDEAHKITHRLAHTSLACRGLVAKHRWAMSGKPIQNTVKEVRTLR
jgi:hypothetical protein